MRKTCPQRRGYPGWKGRFRLSAGACAWLRILGERHDRGKNDCAAYFAAMDGIGGFYLPMPLGNRFSVFAAPVRGLHFICAGPTACPRAVVFTPAAGGGKMILCAFDGRSFEGIPSIMTLPPRARFPFLKLFPLTPKNRKETIWKVSGRI